jgi:hypothetical protein
MTQTRAAPATTASPIDDRAQLTVITGLSAVLFFLVLVPIDAVPEIPVDIDQKPFFVPLTLVALLPVGRASLAVGFGAALGEAMRDVLEGYEVDDTLGFVGYVLAFTVAGFLIGQRPDSRIRLATGALVAGFVQAVFEGASFALLGSEGTDVAIESTVGNTITHGLIGGAIPLVFVAPHFAGKIERFLGFVPKGWDRPSPLAGGPGTDRDGRDGGPRRPPRPPGDTVEALA